MSVHTLKLVVFLRILESIQDYKDFFHEFKRIPLKISF